MLSHRTKKSIPVSSISVFPDAPSEARPPVQLNRLIGDYYSRLFEVDAKDTQYPLLYDRLIEDGTDGVLERFQEYARQRKTVLEELRAKVSLHTATYDKDGEASGRVVGVDAGRNGTDYRFAYVPLYGAVALMVEDWRVVEEPLCAACQPEVWPAERDPQRRESLLHMALEFYVAKRSVELWSPDYLVFDGGLVLNPVLHPRREDSGDYKRDFAFAVFSVLDLLEACRRLGVSVAGFVKRTKMSHLHRVLGFPPTRDTALLSPVMKAGQYTEPFLVRNLVVRSYENFADGFNEGGELTRIYTSYIKTGPTTPFRIEVPSFCARNLGEIASVLFTMADPVGIPYPVHEADRYTRITRPTANMHTLVLFAKALDLVKKGDLDPTDLDMLALQYGESWSLKDEDYLADLASKRE